MSFITSSGTYCYLWMPEGLKNVGGSFSRMTSKVLNSQIGRNVPTCKKHLPTSERLASS
jgi:hypothetical protein